MSDGVPEGWKKHTLAQVATNFTEKYLPDGYDNIRYIGLEHISPEKYLLTRWGYSTEVVSTKSKFEKGDTLFGKLRPYLRKVSFADFSGVCSTDILVIRPKPNMNTSFLFRVLSSDDSIAHSMESSAGNVMPRTSWKDMATYKFLCPPLPEQKKIAAILTSVDEVIEKTEAQINKLQDLKKAMMQTLLTEGIGHTEFKDSPVGRIPRAWKFIEISKLTDNSRNSFAIGPFGSNLVKEDYRRQGVPVLFVRDIKPNRFEWVSNIFVSAKKSEELTAHNVKPGEIVITKMGLPPGIAAIYDKSMPTGIITADIIRLRPNTCKVLPNFIVEMLNSDHVTKQVRDRTAGQTRPKLTLTDYKTISIPLPELKEQKKISGILESIEIRMKSKNILAHQYKALKKSLMQDLLTGKVRVKVN